MAVERVTPEEAARLLEEGWTYLDVRSVPEFEQEHPRGAYNIPLMHKGPGGMTPNPDFLSVVEANFSKDARLVLGCRSGGRSNRAAEMLAGAGFENILDMRGGFGGEMRGGSVTCEGWKARGLPISASADAGRTYDELSQGQSSER